jgi:hypothetical protein
MTDSILGDPLGDCDDCEHYTPPDCTAGVKDLCPKQQPANVSVPGWGRRQKCKVCGLLGYREKNELGTVVQHVNRVVMGFPVVSWFCIEEDLRKEFMREKRKLDKEAAEDIVADMTRWP